MNHVEPKRKRAAPDDRARAAPSFPSRQEAAAGALRTAILKGILRAGARLDIDEIAAAHGMSRTPVRDALKQLEAEGLVRVLPYRGVEVTSLGPDDLAELFAIRIALERLAVAEAARRITAAELDGLGLVLGRMERLSRRDERWVTLNIAFHDGIHDASRLARLVELIRIQRTNVERYVRARAAELGIERQRKEHRALLDALRRRDARKAEEVIAVHLRVTLEALLRPGEG